MNSYTKQRDPSGDAAVEAFVGASLTATGLVSSVRVPPFSQPSTAPVTPVGRVLAVYVSEGDPVKKNQPVVKIDDRLLRLALARAKAVHSQAGAQYVALKGRLASLEAKQRQLRDAKERIAEGRRRLDQGRSQLARARRQLQAGRSQLATARERLEAQAAQLERLSRLAATLSKDRIVLVCLSGRGDKDIQIVEEALGGANAGTQPDGQERA